MLESREGVMQRMNESPMYVPWAGPVAQTRSYMQPQCATSLLEHGVLLRPESAISYELIEDSVLFLELPEKTHHSNALLSSSWM